MDLSDDGKTVVLEATVDRNTFLYLFDSERRCLTKLSATGAPDVHPSVSGNGRYVAYTRASDARTLQYGGWDIYRLDVWTGRSVLVSSASDGGRADGGSETPAISSDGRFVAFRSRASNLVGGGTVTCEEDGKGRPCRQIYLRDVDKGRTVRVTRAASGAPSRGISGYPTISADGRWVAYSSDAADVVLADDNGERDVFLFDRVSSKTKLVSRSRSGGSANAGSDGAVVSRDGGSVVFTSYATDLSANAPDCGRAPTCNEVFLWRASTARVQQVPTRENLGWEDRWVVERPSISGDGRFIAFSAAYTCGDETCGAAAIWDRRGDTSRDVDALTITDLSSSGQMASVVEEDGSFVLRDRWDPRSFVVAPGF